MILGLPVTVLAALRDKNPALALNLEKRGILEEFVAERAQLISSTINSNLQAVRQQEKWDDNPATLVANLNTARSGIAEQVMADLLDFPSEQSPEGTEIEGEVVDLTKISLNDWGEMMAKKIVEELRKNPHPGG